MAEIKGKINQRKSIMGTVDMAKTVYENDYELLKNHPSIKGVVLIGDISLEDLGLAADGITIVSDGGFLMVKDDSHRHVIGNIEGLQFILDSKAEASELITLENVLATHASDKSNPHETTAEQIGLGNVENLAANDLAPTYSDVSELETISSGERLSSVFAKLKLAVSRLISHFADKGNPHEVTKTQLGLGKVENKSSADVLGELTKDYIVALGIPAQDTTYGAVTESANGLATPAMLTKLNGIAAGANKYVHPAYTAKSSGLYKITIDATGHVSAVAAVTKADITGLGIPGQDTNTTYGAVTENANGLATSAMLTKLNGIEAGANKYVHPAYTAKSSGLYKITVDATGHVSAVAAVTKADITALGIPGQDTNTTYGAVTESANGLATPTMLTKLNSIGSASSIIAQASPMEDYFKAF